MEREQQQAILTIALQAAFADGNHDEAEREQIRRLAESLASEKGAPDLMLLYQQVLLRRVDLAAAAATLDEPAHRQWAYEIAVCICNADQRTTEAEKQFLATLADILKLDQGVTAPVSGQAEEMADLLQAAAPPATVQPVSAQPSATAHAEQKSATQSLNPSAPAEAELDRRVLHYSVLAGALELLPQSWAGMAIIPLQVRLVYTIGKDYGYDLDQGHIRELLAALGIGLTSQYLEQFGRKLLGGLFGKALGGIGKQVGKAGTSMAFSFATTYALGQVAKRYYAGGRQMSTDVLRNSFNGLLGSAKDLQAQYLPEIQQKAASLDMAQVMSLVRGR